MLGKARVGRPPKFREPSGPITVTLPKRTLAQLRRIDEDRAKAIVKAADALAGNVTGQSPEGQVVEVAPATGVVLIPANRSLRSIPWLKIIEVATSRHLIAVEPGTPIEKVEVALIDLVEEARLSAPDEVPMLEALRDTIGRLRRGNRISKAEILFIDV
jgi:hypothetical protein